MSLRPQLAEPIPDETVRIARAAFPKGALCMCLRQHRAGPSNDNPISKMPEN
jgi:hypothetical protein